MKRIKKLASMILAMVMMLAMTMTAFAAEGDGVADSDTGNSTPTGYSITINGKTTGHQYEAYQVFVGDLKDTGETDEAENPVYQLSNIRWGDGVDSAALIAGLKADESTKAFFERVNNASDVADVLSTNAATAAAFADVVSKYVTTPVGGTGSYFEEKTAVDGRIPYTKTVDSAGYYFVRDAANSELAEGATYTDYILQVVGAVTVQSKDTTVEIDKKILNPNPVDTNMAGIGDDVTYVLTSKVPDHKAYDYYFFVMEDTLSKGLDFNNDVVVKVGDDTLTRGDDYKVYVGDEEELLEANVTTTEKTFKIAFVDIKGLGIGKDITVTYSAKINKDAEIGSTGNPNTVKLIYSNNPNEKGKPKEKEDKPGIPDKEKNPPTGETPESKVITFVANVSIFKTKVDGATKGTLAGAEFTLTGISTQTVLSGGKVYMPADDGTYYQLKNGEYTTTSPLDKAIMKPLPAGATAGYVEAEEGSTAEGKVVVGGTTYRPYVSGTDSLKTVYILVEPNDSDYASVTQKFKLETAMETTLTSKYISAKGVSDEKGYVVFYMEDEEGNKIPLGLGDGTYTITETKTPDGYNTASPITVKIEGTIVKEDGSALGEEHIIDGTEKCQWTANGMTITNQAKANGVTIENNEVKKPDGVWDGGVYWTEVENRSGSLLPSTGGIGTTVFYVVGGILVIGAGILLVAKKRMSKN